MIFQCRAAILNHTYVSTHLFNGIHFIGSCANRPTGYDYSRDADAWLNLHTKPTSLSNAKMRCQQEGGILASPTTRTLAQVMLVMLAERQLMGTLFTRIKSLSSGEQVLGGVPLNSVPLCWADGAADTEDCSALAGAGALVDVNCARELPYFCRQDNDTITRNLCGSIEYKLELRFASCYKFHRTFRTWFQAYVMCHEEGGELAVIDSPEEAQMLRTMFKENLSPDQAIIGFRTKAGEWVTIDEEPLNATGYEVWSPGEPNNKDGESCGFILRSGMLNDDPCDKLAPSICEITL
ncbi:C-type mannose receptor 2-like [Cydia amplana]|uniref:C-type mannose receptor 2-like n=1 Tax=Cydia amplana TaxID=1869771 RepID=UPI002FE6395F